MLIASKSWIRSAFLMLSTAKKIFFWMKLQCSAVRSDFHRGTTWGKKGETREISSSGRRFGLKLIRAVTTRGDLRLHIIEGKMNSAKFNQFLSKIHRDAGKTILVITDNARYNHSKESQKFIQQQKGLCWSLFQHNHQS